jgi:hypothetical protein
MRTEEFDATVKAYNRAALAGGKLYEMLSEIFKPFVGQQVCKKDGSLLAKISALIPKFGNTPALMIYKHTTPLNYSLVWVAKTSEQVQGKEFCVYQEVSVYIGELRDGVLTALCPPPNLRHDYTVEEVERNRQAVKEAQKTLDDARSKLHPFGD